MPCTMVTAIVDNSPSLREIGMEERAAGPSDASSAAAPRDLAFFVSCANLSLDVPDSAGSTIVNLTQQTMQRGYALAKTMMRKDTTSGSAPWDGSSFCQVTVHRDRLSNGSPSTVTYRTETIQKSSSSPAFVVGMTLPAADLSPSDSVTFELMSTQLDRTKQANVVLATTPSVEMHLLLDAAAAQSKPLSLPLSLQKQGPSSDEASASNVEIDGDTTTTSSDDTTTSIELVWPRAVPPATMAPFLPTHRTLYRWPLDQLSQTLQETIAETTLCAVLPQQILAQSSADLSEQIGAWQRVRDRAALAECLFDDVASGLAMGCDAVQVAVHRARGLSLSGAPLPLMSADSVTTNIRSSMFALAKSVKSSALSKLRATGATASSSENSIHAYCELRWRDPNTMDGVWTIGRTNTILNNPEPRWRPETPAVKLRSRIAADTFFEFHRPPNAAMDGFLECHVLVDPAKGTSAKSSRKSHISVGYARLPLVQVPVDASGTFIFQEWVRLHQRDDPDSLCRCDDDGQCVGEVEVQFKLVRGADGAYRQHTDNVPLPSLVAAAKSSWLQPSTPLALLPTLPSTTFVDKQLATLHDHKSTLEKLMAVSTQWMDNKKCFKSSHDKKTWSVQHIPTNLHVSWLHMLSTADDPPRALPTVSCGIPAAHALGLDTDLVRLDDAITDASKDCIALQTPMSSVAREKFGLAGLSNDCDVFEPVVELLSGAAAPASFLSSPSLPPAPQPTPSETTPRAMASRLNSLYSSAKRNLPPVPSAFKSSTNGDKPSLVAQWARVLELQGTYHLRKTMVVAQALTALTAAFQAAVVMAMQEGPLVWADRLALWQRVGFLCGWESLVSSQGKELHMLHDAHAGLLGCKHFLFQLVPMVSPTKRQVDVVLDGNIVEVPVDGLAAGGDPSPIPIVSVLFTQGINEMQSLANMSSHLGSKSRASGRYLCSCRV
ncbi:hypothetical protein, variant 1 [Aphanomyces invadans]|uniref:C2 domain-containing protein n=1 Tax=Aphanomyces invadans TaxID=157072 RepID=A0A024UGU2_9STRA|nr:hypothetical protein, variant 1 [Aphanomyces invadans]ETW05390.1 hypothetical protein, variant 1 [Aphanomyces invadans]|eukprot:XP_008866827.1 hypothetical protein, variant 1 [Aphanomyces invadans]